MQNLNKIDTYIGFSVKSGQVVYGIDNLLVTKKRLKLILLCNTLSAQTEKKINEFASMKGIPLIKLTHKKLEDALHKTNCKVIGLTNKNLAQAIITVAQDRADSPKGGDI